MSFAGITDLWAYLIGCIAIILLPGPNSLLVMSTAALDGRRLAWAAVGGVVVADTVYIVGSAMGLVALLHAVPWVFDLLRWVGGAYLAWLGLSLIVTAWRESRSPRLRAATFDVRSVDAWPAGAAMKGSPATRRSAAASPRRIFRKAIAIGLLNPKALMFYVAFFPQFVDPATSNAWTFVAMGTILQCCSLAYLTVLVLSGERLAAAARRSTWLSVLGKSTTGLLFIGFGARLAAARPVS